MQAVISQPHSATVKRSHAFRVIDEGSLRSDLARRREMKFLLRGADVGKLRSLLEGNGRRQVHNHKVSTVRSIYFDDLQLSACHANLDGVGRRRKVRLRWYDMLRPANDFFFEIKWRDNHVTGKHRVQMQFAEPLASLPYHTIINHLFDVLPGDYVRDLAVAGDPIAMVEYKREHFTSNDGLLRVTLDYDLAFYDQTGKRFISTNFVHRMDGFVLIEGKVPLGRETELKRQLHPFHPRADSCSKYVFGCRMLGLIS
jgi:hypothetical protein